MIITTVNCQSHFTSSHQHHVGITDGRKLKKYKCEVASSGKIVISTYMKICQLVQELLEARHGWTHTH